jgi:hypothetical protein
MSATGRESTYLEMHFNDLHHRVRNLDKLLWHLCGDAKIARQVAKSKSKFDMMKESYKEVEHSLSTFKDALHDYEVQHYFAESL